MLLLRSSSHDYGYSQYNQRARVEGQFARWKQVIGDGLRFHSDEARATGCIAARCSTKCSTGTPELRPRRMINRGEWGSFASSFSMQHADTRHHRPAALNPLLTLVCRFAGKTNPFRQEAHHGEVREIFTESRTNRQQNPRRKKSIRRR